VKGLKENFDRKRAELEQHLKKVSNGQPSKFYLDADFDTIDPMSAETDALRTQIFERLSVGGRLIGLLTALIGTVQRLNDSLESRNALIAEIQAQRPLPENVLIEVYFGLQQSWRGTTDKRYADYVASLRRTSLSTGSGSRRNGKANSAAHAQTSTSRCSISPKRSSYTQTRSATPSGSPCSVSIRSKNDPKIKAERIGFSIVADRHLLFHLPTSCYSPAFLLLFVRLGRGRTAAPNPLIHITRGRPLEASCAPLG
jgi:hypothetical protein